MKVYYNKALGLGFIVFGIGLMFLGLVSGGQNPAFIIGGLEIWLGVTFLRKHYLIIYDNKLELYALAGNLLTTYDYQSLKEIEVDNNKIFLNQNGERRKIRVSTWMIDKGDWQKVLEKIKSGV